MADPLTLPDPEPIDEGPLAGTHRWTFQVVASEELTSEVRRLHLRAPHLDRLDARPGQDLMVAVPTDATDGPSTVNRRYSIRQVVASDPGHVVVDVVTHGGGPGARWASTAQAGEVVVAVGPRGKVLVDADASSHLFMGDAAGAPASLSMVESVPGSGRALLVVDSDDQVQPTTADGSVTWLVGASPDEVAERLVAEIGDAPAGLHVYLAGERRDIARWRDVLLAAGVESDQISSKAYWSRGAANAAHGEPARQG
ncbi:MAG TPA: siderophore-interacting protein [Acidimicrobiales bacterium]